MLQCIFTGRAQEAYASLSSDDSKKYKLVKNAVLRAFELVPDAYRKCFRTWRKGEKQTYLELAGDLARHFDRWCAALEVSDYDGLCELIVLEQFKNTLPEHIANHISDQKVKTAATAAALADEYVLRHRCGFGERRLFSQHLFIMVMAMGTGHVQVYMQWAVRLKGLHVTLQMIMVLVVVRKEPVTTVTRKAI